MKIVSIQILLAFFVLCLLQIADAKKDVDYYAVFNMNKRNFDKEKLHKEYRKLAKQYHPDKNKGDKEAETKFIEITKAFEVLNDDQKRRTYDQFGAEAVENQGQGGAHDFRHAEDIFNAFFGGGFGGGGGFADFFGHGRQQKRKGPDARLEISAPLEAFYKGETITVEVHRQQLCTKCKGTGAKNPDEVSKCTTCRGTGTETIMQQIAPGFVQQMHTTCRKCQGRGKIFAESCKECSGRRVFKGPTKLDVEIRAGMADGTAVSFPGKSDEQPDIEAGDLYVVVRQEPHAKFRRNGADLYTEVHLTLAEALLGFSKKLKHLDDHDVTLSHTNVIQPDYVQTVTGEGMPYSNNPHRHGNLYVTYKVTLPSSLSAEQSGFFRKALVSGIDKSEL